MVLVRLGVLLCPYISGLLLFYCHKHHVLYVHIRTLHSRIKKDIIWYDSETTMRHVLTFQIFPNKRFGENVSVAPDNLLKRSF